MKNLAIFASALLMSNVANGAVVHVTSRPIAMGGGTSSLVFNYNENGRAWIEEKDTNGYSEGAATSYLHYHLPGLRFNLATREIIFGRVACANVVPMALGTETAQDPRFSAREATVQALSPVCATGKKEFNIAGEGWAFKVL